MTSPTDPDVVVKKVLTDVMAEAQRRLGDSPDAIVAVLNGAIWATLEYCVNTTTGEPVEMQRRYDELSETVAKVIQEFLAKYTGACALVEIPREGEDGKRRG